jgi:hypothetical protein
VNEDAIVTIDCGGTIFRTFLRTLRRIPKTRMFRMAEPNGELAKSKFLFLDRNPDVFGAILEYHRHARVYLCSSFLGVPWLSQDVLAIPSPSLLLIPPVSNAHSTLSDRMGLNVLNPKLPPLHASKS